MFNKVAADVPTRILTLQKKMSTVGEKWNGNAGLSSKDDFNDRLQWFELKASVDEIFPELAKRMAYLKNYTSSGDMKEYATTAASYLWVVALGVGEAMLQDLAATRNLERVHALENEEYATLERTVVKGLQRCIDGMKINVIRELLRAIPRLAAVVDVLYIKFTRRAAELPWHFPELLTICKHPKCEQYIVAALENGVRPRPEWDSSTASLPSIVSTLLGFDLAKTRILLIQKPLDASATLTKTVDIQMAETDGWRSPPYGDETDQEGKASCVYFDPLESELV